jgi:hypothetical protein
MGTKVFFFFFPGDKNRGVTVFTHLLPAPRVRMGGAIPPLPYMSSLSETYEEVEEELRTFSVLALD